MICEVLTNRFAVYMTHSDVHGRIDKKKKHWEICIETSQCLISIIEMFFSNLPMFFRFSKRTKGQKGHI